MDKTTTKTKEQEAKAEKTLKGTKTEANLKEAFAGESMARNKYDFFASKARKDGFEQIAAILEETAENEKEHAKLWFKLLNNGGAGETAANLAASAAGEKDEYTGMYVRMAKEAKAEGFTDIAAQFEKVAAIEKSHEARFLALQKNIEKKQVFEKPTDQIWHCRNCGHEMKGKEAPFMCPTCNHPRFYFEVKQTNY